MGSRAAPRKRGALGVLLGLAAASAFACDVVQGFKHAGDALFPPVKTYLDAPGYRLVEGGYRQLVLVTSSELFVLARGASTTDDALYSIRYAVPAPCTIPEVGRYWAGGSVDVGAAWIAFFHDGAVRGTLSFSDTGCHVSPLTLPDAELPYARITPRGADGELEKTRMLLLIRSAGRLLLVDPASVEEPRLLIEPADGLLLGIGKQNVNFVLSAGRLAVFDADWNYVTTVADGITNVTSLGDAIFFEDVNGVQKATPTTRGGEIVVDIKVLAADGCGLAFPASSRKWIAFFSPCVDRTLTIVDDNADETTRPDLVIDDTRALILTPKPELTGTPTPALENVWAYFLREIDYAAGVGTLVARAPDGTELVLGARGALERTVLDKRGEYGYALLDVNGDVGHYVRWQPDGSVTELAENVLRESPSESFADLMIDWNGTTGTLAQRVEGELFPVLEGVPKRGYAYQDVHQRQALFSDFDGKTGTLSIGEAACTPGAPNCEREYYIPRVVARGVHHPGHAFLDESDEFLPGIGFLDQFDEEHSVGRFQYRNLELGFTSIVSEGVSDFVYAGNGVLYAVPFGEGAGIWLARAK
jgi:hypothetical protein